MSFASPLLAVTVTVLIGIALFALLGTSPANGLWMFFVEPLKNAYNLSELSLKATPLILIGLGLAVCYRSNVWNIGCEGQFIVGALAGGWVAMQAGPSLGFLGRGVVVAILVASVLGGMAWGALVALLRDRFNASEILVSLMLVYVATFLLDYLVYGPWKDPDGHNFPQSINFLAATKIPRLIDGMRLNIGTPLALAAVLGIWALLFRTYRGFQLQVGGLAPLAARYAGFSSRAALWTALLLSGGLAGLAGGLEAAGPTGQLTPYLPAGYGFAAIIVAYVGRLHPVGIIFSAILMSMFYLGGEYAQSRLGLPRSLTGVFQGLLLFTLLATDTLIVYRIRWQGSPPRRAPASPPAAAVPPGAASVAPIGEGKGA
jgi:simple sugar transport system permease protein